MPGRDNNGLTLYGWHEYSRRNCSSGHAMAQSNGAQMTGFQPLRHHMDNISQVLCHWLKKENSKFTPSQTYSLVRLRCLLKNPIPANPESIVAALDTIFFGKLLKNRITVVITDTGSSQGKTRVSKRSVPPVPEALILVSDYMCDGYYRSRPRERRLRIVATLIHEMCHAFLRVYSCDGRQCATWDGIANGRGFTGHGPAWEKVARGAEEVFREHIVPMVDVEGYKQDPLGVDSGLNRERNYRRKWF